MVKVEYPPYEFKIKEEDDKELIFDEIRKRWVRLTPEEWVRQNIIQYLIKVKKYPSSLMAVEKEIKLNDLRKRCDVVVYKNEKPWMIIECKEMNELLNENVLMQCLRYNIPLAAQYIAITNGSYTHVWSISQQHEKEEPQFPDYN